MIDADDLVRQVGTRSDVGAPGSDGEFNVLKGTLHGGVVESGAQIEGEDGEVADFEALGDVAQHHDFGGVGEEENVPWGGAWIEVISSSRAN